MKVILLEDIERLGAAGDIIEVAKGYARNFLLPRKLAMESNAGNLHALEAIKRKKQQKIEKEKQEVSALAGKINALSCTIPVLTGEEEKLYGSVTPAEIAAAYAAEGIELDKKQIELKEPINKIGVYQIPVRLKHDIIATAKVWVVKK